MNIFIYICILIFSFSLANLTYSKNIFVALSGGNSPDRNQIAHEKNIIFYQNFLSFINIPIENQFIFFSDGTNSSIDTCYIDNELKISQIDEILSSLYNSTANVRMSYKNNDVKNISNSASKREINSWFNNNSGDFSKDDVIIIYVTDHGGLNYANSNDNYIVLWNSERLYVSDLNLLLNKLNPETLVILIMTQCYSGSFSNVIWENANPSDELNKFKRCGFFSSRKELISAGCTADVNEQLYDDYSTRFFAAVYKKDRIGNDLQLVDYDEDGKTSLIEAHYYCIINENSVDTPIMTSDAYLRKRCFPINLSNYSIKQVLAKADKLQKTVLELLIKTVNTDIHSASDIAKSFSEIETELQQKLVIYQKEHSDSQQLNNVIREKLDFYHPILKNPYSPNFRPYVNEKANDIIVFLTLQPEFTQWQTKMKYCNILENQITTLRKQSAKLLRIEYLIESILLQDELYMNNNTKYLEEYKKIKLYENYSFN